MYLPKLLLALAALIGLTPVALLLTDGAGVVAVAQSQSQPLRPGSQQAQSQPSGPVRTETTAFDNWVLVCQEQPPAAGSKTAKKTCWATMQIVNNQSKQRVAVWKIGRDAKDAPTMAITTPTGVLVRDGVDLQVGPNPRKFAYQWCDPKECEASVAYDQAMANELSGAKEATIAFRLRDGRQVNVKVSIVGIDKVLAALRKV